VSKVEVKYVTSVLREQHDHILRAPAVLDKVLSFPSPDPDNVYALVQFAQHFVDACHHSVEEYVLFQGTDRAGFPLAGGPIQFMVCEHGVGRYLARVMEELYHAWKSGDKETLRDLVDYARMYIDHLSQHIEIERENNHERRIAELDRVAKKYGL